MHWLILDVGVRRPNDSWNWPTWINFSEHDLRKLTQLLSHNEQVVWQGNKQIEKCFEKISNYIQEADTPESIQTRLQLYINELFLEVFEMLQVQNIKLNAKLTSTRRSVEMFLAGLSEHIDYPWTLDSGWLVYPSGFAVYGRPLPLRPPPLAHRAFWVRSCLSTSRPEF